MNAISESGKVYVHILELHRNITDENVRDSIPEVRIATTEGTDHINWSWIIQRGFMPIVKGSPTILKSTMKDYVFTPEFWICDCEFDWLRTKQFVCPECKSTVINHMNHNSVIMPATEALWGKGPFPCIQETLIEGMTTALKKSKDIVPSGRVLYGHLKAFNFNWIEAFDIQNF